MPTNITYKGSLLTTVNNNQAKILKTSGKYLEDDITVSSALNLQGKTTSITPNTSIQTTTINPDSGYEGLSGVTVTVNPIPSQYIIPAGTITITSNGTHDVSQYADANVSIDSVNNQNKTVIPSEATQTVTADTGYTGLGTVTVNGITPTYIGSSVPRCDSDDISTTYDSTANRIKTSVSTGYYSGNNLTQRPDIILPTQSATTIIPSETAQTAIEQYKWTTGTVTVAAITSTYVGSSITRPGLSGISNSITNGYYKISVSPGYYPGTANKSLGLENPTIIPSETQQVKRPTSNNYYIESVTVAAITPTYVGSEVPTGSLTVSGPTVTASAGYYASAATKTIPNAVIADTITIPLTSANTFSIDENGLVSATRNYMAQTSPAVKSAGYITATASDFIRIEIPKSTSTYQLPVQATTTITPSSATQTITGQKYMTGDITVQPIPSQYIVPSGTLTITSVDTTTTFDATSYASVAVNLKDADVTAY